MTVEIRQFIRQMSGANPLWGAQRFPYVNGGQSDVIFSRIQCCEVVPRVLRLDRSRQKKRREAARGANTKDRLVWVIEQSRNNALDHGTLP
jgi:hypothetical protein